MGRALSSALGAAGVAVRGPLGRGATSSDAAVVLLCVPDREISVAARLILPGALVGHVSASAPLSALEPHERFFMHPLLSVLDESAQFAGAMCAVDGSSPRTLAVAQSLAERLGMRPRTIPADQRALYHAMASAASNYLTTVLGLAEHLALQLGIERSELEPLVRASVSHWVARGAGAALTGPIARGDEVTVARQREAVASAAPETIPLWDALVDGTRVLARTSNKDVE